MKPRTKVYKFIALLLSLLLLLPSVPLTAAAPTPAELTTLYNQLTAAGLTVTLSGANFTVTGGTTTPRTTTLLLQLPQGAAIDWSATLRSSGNPAIDIVGQGGSAPHSSFTIQGGLIENTSSASATAIRVNGAVELTVAGGAVLAGLGSAIEGAGAGTVVVVSSGEVQNQATSNLRPVINMTYAFGVDAEAHELPLNVIIEGDALVAATSTGNTQYGYAIQSYGHVEVRGGRVITSAGYGRGVNLTGNYSSIRVTGGEVIATGQAGVAISTATTAGMVVNRTLVEVSGGFVASYATGNGWAIHTTGNHSVVSITGGTVFAFGDRLTGSANSVIYTEKANEAGSGLQPGHPQNPAVVVAWAYLAWDSLPHNRIPYTLNTSVHLRTWPDVAPVWPTLPWTTAPARPGANFAVWDKDVLYEGVATDGISYNLWSGANSGFIPLSQQAFADGHRVQVQGAPGLTLYNLNPDEGVIDPWHGSLPTAIYHVPYGSDMSFTFTPSDTVPLNRGSYLSELRGFVHVPATFFADLYNSAHDMPVVHELTLSNITNDYYLRATFSPNPVGQYTLVTSVLGTGGTITPTGQVFYRPFVTGSDTVTVRADDRYRILAINMSQTTINSAGAVTVTPTTIALGGSDTETFVAAYITDLRRTLITATFEPTLHGILARALPGGEIAAPAGVGPPTRDGERWYLNVPHNAATPFPIVITADPDYYIADILVDGRSIIDENIPALFPGATYLQSTLSLYPGFFPYLTVTLPFVSVHKITRSPPSSVGWSATPTQSP